MRQYIIYKKPNYTRFIHTVLKQHLYIQHHYYIDSCMNNTGSDVKYFIYVSQSKREGTNFKTKIRGIKQYCKPPFRTFFIVILV